MSTDKLVIIWTDVSPVPIPHVSLQSDRAARSVEARRHDQLAGGHSLVLGVMKVNQVLQQVHALLRLNFVHFDQVL